MFKDFFANKFSTTTISFFSDAETDSTDRECFRDAELDAETNSIDNENIDASVTPESGVGNAPTGENEFPCMHA